MHHDPSGAVSPVPIGQAAAAVASADDGIDRELADVANIHGEAGPWAVAGYRMGKYALGRLGIPRQSFDLEVIHHSPRQVRYACIADGAAAATGASLGKLNLTLVETDAARLSTTYRRKSTGQSITLRPSPSFEKRFSSMERNELHGAGRVAMALGDEEVFEEAPAPRL
ncbi:MAG: hypothetical protein NVS3B20_08510 [Polyangiales bacterium]